MKKLFTLMLALTLSAATLKAQILITPDTNTVQLVNDFILSGVSASNVLYTGGPQTLGTFTNGNTTNIGLTDGIIMTTGTLAPIGNPVTDFASGVTGGGSDPSLHNILPGYSLNDASILEFDLVPVGNVLEFGYVFASEEYPEYVNSAFNDIFGFFISGPNPQGGNYSDHNIAIVPGTSLPVAIDNINAGNNAAYFVDNLALNGQTIVFDGFTTPLLAQVSVIPLATYHLKMAIADAGDASYDSGIFLKAQSMKSYLVTGTDSYYSSNVIAYPNPSATDVTLLFNNSFVEAVVEIFSLQGQLMSSEKFLGNEIRVSTGFLKPGLYSIHINSLNFKETIRLVKK